MPLRVLHALTGLRFVAALHVLVGHLSGTFAQGWPGWAMNFVRTGYIGVSLFFLLSGFILVYTQLDPETREMRAQKGSPVVTVG
ncbi:acyltransferase family protein [Cryobacterium sp. TMT4-10]|uniref:acyltransferase family protein n=1 Tax=Cryobacterium sp. TMT4-10 TaxID=1259256 RepID=UPI00106DAF8E|nr:acyltransferase family protein [Cryobacterium sp. TMT4-10]TFD16310.1 hypothetical protein E3T42_09495 [Cryobacterium sp. TMT4-10]